MKTDSKLSKYPYHSIRVFFTASQDSLLPDTLGGNVDEDHPVLMIDAFVDILDMKALGFNKA